MTDTHEDDNFKLFKTMRYGPMTTDHYLEYRTEKNGPLDVVDPPRSVSPIHSHSPARAPTRVLLPNGVKWGQKGAKCG